jgi:hypothetical protein
MDDHHANPEAGTGHLRLEAIEGLGPQSAEKLRSVGIHTIAELSDFRDSDQLHEYLLARGIAISLQRIRNEGGHKGDWVSQARRHHARTWVVEFGADRATEPTSWSTTVSSDELGIEERFDGTDPATWAGWILEQSVLPVQAGAREEAGAAGAVAARDEDRLEVVVVDVLEPEPTSRVDRDQLDAQIEVRLPTPRSTEVGAQAPYLWIELFAVSEDSGKPLLLASTLERFERAASTHVATVAFGAPEVGRYRLYCLASCVVPRLRVGCTEGPRLTVVERGSRAS